MRISEDGWGASPEAEVATLSDWPEEAWPSDEVLAPDLPDEPVAAGPAELPDEPPQARAEPDVAASAPAAAVSKPAPVQTPPPAV